MNENTQTQTLFSQSMFDSLFTALKRNSGDVDVKDILDSLAKKGYTSKIVVEKVRKTMGQAAAGRVANICAGRPTAAIAQVKSKPRETYRVSRSRRMKLRLREWQEDLEDKFWDIEARVRSAFGRR